MQVSFLPRENVIIPFALGPSPPHVAHRTWPAQTRRNLSFRSVKQAMDRVKLTKSSLEMLSFGGQLFSHSMWTYHGTPQPREKTSRGSKMAGQTPKLAFGSGSSAPSEAESPHLCVYIYISMLWRFEPLIRVQVFGPYPGVCDDRFSSVDDISEAWLPWRVTWSSQHAVCKHTYGPKYQLEVLRKAHLQSA